MGNNGLQPAYVLHNRRYRESSLIVEFLTRDHGRVAALAKGVLGGKRPRQQLLQPFVPLLAAWRGLGELPTLTTIEAAGPLRLPRGNTLYCGLYVNELLLKLTQRGDPYSELFPAYALCLTELLQADNQNRHLEPALRRFEVRLLQELGLGMSLTHDQQGRPLEPALQYRYDFQSGPVVAGVGEYTVRGSTLIGLNTGEFANRQELLEARRLMRHVLAHHLGGQPLKSRELFRGSGGQGAAG